MPWHSKSWRLSVVEYTKFAKPVIIVLLLTLEYYGNTCFCLYFVSILISVCPIIWYMYGNIYTIWMSCTWCHNCLVRRVRETLSHSKLDPSFGRSIRFKLCQAVLRAFFLPSCERKVGKLFFIRFKAFVRTVIQKLLTWPLGNVNRSCFGGTQRGW